MKKNETAKQGKERAQSKTQRQEKAQRSAESLNNRSSVEDYHEHNAGNANQSRQLGDDYRSTDLRDSPMMAHLMDALKEGTDIGEYGRLTFVMVARHFLSADELAELLQGQPGMEEREIRAMILQVNERDYNPPKRERILQWQERQEFPICPDASDQNGCNVYRELQFPDRIYEQINDYWEERAESDQ
jgi:hypothetical protein